MLYQVGSQNRHTHTVTNKQTNYK